MYNNDGHGKAILDWSSPSTPERIISEYDFDSQPESMFLDGSGLPVISGIYLFWADGRVSP